MDAPPDHGTPSNRPTTPALEVKIVRSLAEVEAIREHWAAVKGHRDGNIDFCLNFVWRAPQFVRPHVVAIYRNGRPDAILVGRLENARIQPKIGYLRLPAVPTRLLNFAHGCLLGNCSGENADELVRAAVLALQSGEADAALFDRIPVGSEMYSHASTVPGWLMRDHVIRSEPHSSMALAPTIDQVFAAFSSGLRAEVRRKKRKIVADFGDHVKISCYFDESELEGVLPQVEEIAKKTYQRALRVGFENSEGMLQRLRLCARLGWLRVFLLTIENKPCAFWIGTVYDGAFYSDFNGYDPSYRDYSLGTFLLMSMIEDFCNAGVRAVDFGFGQAEYKDRFSNCRSTESSVYIFSTRLRGMELNTLRIIANSADRIARGTLGRTELLQKMKKLWRARSIGKSSGGSAVNH
jgi:CelD/BcsL family acetyltransferase involved in cellulose biosynthesis